jgi:geranylgeranyl pyrophosphate synthase
VSKLLTTTTFFTPVQESLKLVEKRMRSQSDGHHPDLGAALGHLLSSGGKRIRPAVALLTGGMLGADPDRLITLAAAIELLHTATLVHDDLIDGALLRRGIPTLNARWTPAATVLAGDFVFARAAKLASETDSVEVMRLFAETLSTIVNGEITQMFSTRAITRREEYYERIYAKTASMFVLATSAAAVLSPVGEDAAEAVRIFGYEIGMAFQIVDDVLDFTGEQAEVGKPVASDLRQGLITLPTIIYMENNPGDPDIDYLKDGHHYNETRLNRLIPAIRESSAIEDALCEARQFVDRGLDALAELSLPMTTERRALEDLALYIVKRHR